MLALCSVAFQLLAQPATLRYEKWSALQLHLSSIVVPPAHDLFHVGPQ